MKKSIELLEEFEKNNNINYDKVIIYRPDLILIKDLNLNKYDNDKIYVNKHGNCQGDFHFIMNSYNVKNFKYLYDSIYNGNQHKTHFWIKNYINNFMQKEVIEDDIVAGIDQEVIRKVQDGTNNNMIFSKILQEYNGS
jgi:hypothetical protein